VHIKKKSNYATASVKILRELIDDFLHNIEMQDYRFFLSVKMKKIL